MLLRQRGKHFGYLMKRITNGDIRGLLIVHQPDIFLHSIMVLGEYKPYQLLNRGVYWKR